jgi:hypothetical protein
MFRRETDTADAIGAVLATLRRPWRGWSTSESKTDGIRSSPFSRSSE